MNHSYAKVFSSMFTGSMYGAGCHVFATWVWVLTHKDENGHVEVNPRLVAAELGASVEQVQAAMEYLTAPDCDSRSPDEDGRRMIRIGQFAYRVVNHQKYRSLGQGRTEYWRQYKGKRRSGDGAAPQAAGAGPEVAPEDRRPTSPVDNVDSVDRCGMSTVSTVDNVDNCGMSTNSTHTDADTDTDTEETTPVVVVSSVGARGNDDDEGGGRDRPWLSMVAKDVLADCRQVIERWNAFAKQPVRSSPEEQWVESQYAALRLGVPPNRLTHEQIVGAVENYRMACALPSSQAPKLALGKFLAWDLVTKYLPGMFTLEHYDAARFRDTDRQGHRCAKQHMGGCSGPGVHRHESWESGTYWLCDAHEARSRQVAAEPTGGQAW